MKRYMVFVRICFYVLYVLYIQNVPKYMKYMKLCSSKTTAKIMYRRKEKNMENKQYSRYGTGADCPLHMMANYEYPECRGANCAWWSGNCCSVQSISMNTGDIESVADALYER